MEIKKTGPTLTLCKRRWGPIASASAIVPDALQLRRRRAMTAQHPPQKAPPARAAKWMVSSNRTALAAGLLTAAALVLQAAGFSSPGLPPSVPSVQPSCPGRTAPSRAPAGPRVDFPFAPVRGPAAPAAPASPGLLGLPHPRHARAAQKIQALAQTVAKIKQELSRRDMFKAVAKRLVGSATGLATIMAAPGPRAAFGEGPAAAADKCPNLKELGKKNRLPDFTEKLYQGVWYELAYHDVTQANYFCGCTRFNFTVRSDNFIEDMFTTTCPMTGILPGEDVAKRVYTLNMSITYSPSKPGEFVETGFQTGFPNVVLYVWTKTGKDGKQYYDRSLQMQCVEAAGRILFVGINFLARAPKVLQSNTWLQAPRALPACASCR